MLSSVTKAEDTNLRILFIREDEGKTALYTMLPDGTGVKKLVDSMFEEGGEITFASLSPDGTKLVFSSSKGRDNEFNYPWDEIFLLDMVTGTMVQVTDDQQNNTLPRWSPDSRHFAYLTGNGINGYGELWMVDSLSLSKEVIADVSLLSTAALAPIAPEERNPILQNFDWSPDGNQLVIRGQIGLPDVYNNVFIINVFGSEVHQVTPSDIHVGNPAWSSNPYLIYMSCEENTARHHEICELNLETLELRVISDLQRDVPEEFAPYVYNLDVSSGGDLIFTYGINPSTIYWFNIASRSLPVPIVEIDNFRYFLGWIELPE